MINEEIINVIQDENFNLDSLDDVAQKIIPCLQHNIDLLSSRIVPQITTGDLLLTRQAFQLRVKSVIKYALHTYISNKRWQTNIKLYPYLLKSINRFGNVIIAENQCDTKTRAIQNVCPACKEYKMREVLDFDGKSFLCNNCYLKINDISKEIKNCSDSITLDYLEKKLYFVKSFSKHSKDGVKCPNCNRFVPESCYIDDFLICPYPKCNADCSEAIPMKHPVQVIKRYTVDINYKPKELEGTNYSGIYCTDKEDAFNLLDDEEDLKNKKEIIQNVIRMQKKTHANLKKMPNKYCMYEAFEYILQNFPEDMVKYITIGGQRDGISIQSMIYQAFCNKMEKYLPIRFFTKGQQVLIENVLDSRLHLYDGAKQFTNFVDQNNCVKKKIQYNLDKNTFEKSIETQDSFIAKIFSITDQYGCELIDFVDEYNFTSVKMKNDDKVKPGTVLTIKYYSIRPNYTLGSMIYLQRIKKKLKDSTSRKLETLYSIRSV
jgi:hypothetical protein